MEIEYALDEADLIALANHQIEKSPMAQRRFRARRWIYTLAFGLLAAGIYLTTQVWLLAAVFTVWAVLTFILLPKYYPQLIRKRLKRIIEQRKTPSSTALRKLRCTSQGLEQILDNAESKVTWRLVNQIDKTPAYTFIAIEGTYSVVIPKAKLAPENYEAFVAQLQQLYQTHRDSTKTP